MLPVDEVKIDPVTVNNIRLGKSIYKKKQLEEFAAFQDSQGTRECLPGGDCRTGLHGEEQEGRVGPGIRSPSTAVTPRPGINELLHPLLGGGPANLLFVPPADGVGRTSVGGDDFPKGGYIREVQGLQGVGVDSFLGHAIPAGCLPLQLDRQRDGGCCPQSGVMLDNKAARTPEGEETEEQNLEDLRRKYLWWLNGRGGKKAAAPARKADTEDTVILFEGKNTCV
jgi:hypothetical protein